GRSVRVALSLTIETRLLMNATMSAICSTMRIAPVLLRFNAARIGAISKFIRLTALDLQRRIDLHRAPGRIETRHQSGRHRHYKGRREKRRIQLRDSSHASGKKFAQCPKGDQRHK